MPKNSEVEIQWTHFAGDVSATTTGGLDLPSTQLRRDDIMINGYWYAYRPTSNVMPYLTLGAGSSIFDTDNTSSIGRFGWNLGAGFRVDPSEKTALRIGIRWMPVWLTTGSGVWCDPFYCYSVGTGESYDQWDVSGALIIKM
jgi:opacity protein-like surface antigen